MTTEYLFVAVSGLAEIQKWTGGKSESEARSAFWASLSDEQRDATESVECIDERPAAA